MTYIANIFLLDGPGDGCHAYVSTREDNGWRREILPLTINEFS